MFANDTRRKIENITAGVVIERQQDHCTTIRNILCSRFETSTTVKTDFESKAISKEDQKQLLIDYCNQHDLWVKDLPKEDAFLARGGESRVYLHSDNRHVLKVNDGIYYATWLEFFNSILLHNLIFPNTAYELIGFLHADLSFFAVLKQPYIIADTQVELDDIRKLLLYNGFELTKSNDYRHVELGLILEDMHDENVLVREEILFFIDTVFYTAALNC